RHVALVRREALDRPAADADRAARERLEPRGEAQQGRLAAARGAEHGDQLAVLDREREVGERDDVVEALGDPLELGARHQRPLPAKTPARSAGSSTRRTPTAGTLRNPPRSTRKPTGSASSVCASQSPVPTGLL